MTEATAYLALGSNLGDREAHLEAALDALDAHPAVRVTRRSPVIETEPVGPGPQGKYLNAACEVRTTLSPRELLGVVQAIERSRGRVRSGSTRWGPRTLDIDILLFGGLEIDEPGLRVPHPRMAERSFVLEPLAAIAGGVVVPGAWETVSALLERCRPCPSRGGSMVD